MATKKYKHVVSISLGSSTRDAEALLTFGAQEVLVERRGTDGDWLLARSLLSTWDGVADALGLGGTDLALHVGERCYPLRAAQQLLDGVHMTPVLDGSGLKNTLERRLVADLARSGLLNFQGLTVLVVSAADRFGLAEALEAQGARLTLGDLAFGLGVPVTLHSLKALARLARVAAPVVTRLPLRWLYPLGKAQEERTPRFTEYFAANAVIAGDFHYIRKYMPPNLAAKTIITNTVTAADRAMLKEAQLTRLITTTPCYAGRSFGTNVMEACLVALAGRSQALTPAEYLALSEFYGISYSQELFSAEA